MIASNHQIHSIDDYFFNRCGWKICTTSANKKQCGRQNWKITTKKDLSAETHSDKSGPFLMMNPNSGSAISSSSQAAAVVTVQYARLCYADEDEDVNEDE